MDRANRVLELLYDRGEHYFSRVELTAQAGLDPSGLDRAIDNGHRFLNTEPAKVSANQRSDFDVLFLFQDTEQQLNGLLA